MKAERLVLIGFKLWRILFGHGNLITYEDDELRCHISHAVALGMPAWAAMQEQSQSFRVLGRSDGMLSVIEQL